MFNNNYAVKEGQSVSKTGVKELRAEVNAALGDARGDFFDLTVGRNGIVTKRKYAFAARTSAYVYSVSDVPLFISVDRLAGEDQTLITGTNQMSFPMVPTIFFFLRLHQLLADNKEQWQRVVDETCVSVVCRGPTSRYLLGGAHLMVPGILAIRRNETVVPGNVTLIYSAGLDIPYAVGFVTSGLIAGAESGIGVYVVQCFQDKLWKESENLFVAKYSLTSATSLIPPQFTGNEVLEIPDNAAESGDVQLSDDTVAPTAEREEVTLSQNSEETELFSDEDALLTFCLCEAVKQLTNSMLPVTLPQFTSSVVKCFPRDGVHSKPIQFKETKYKKALPFFEKFPELLSIAETTPGVHSLLRVSKQSEVMVRHECVYKTFLETTHCERLQEETRIGQAKLLADGSVMLRQSIVSCGVFYAASRDLDDDLARVLLLGEELNIPDDVRFPSIEQVTNGTVPVYAPTPLDPGIFGELYTRKTLTDNLRKYIKAHSLLIVDEAVKGRLPNVKIDDILSRLLSSKIYASELPLDQLEKATLGRFRLQHEIILQTSVDGSAMASEHMIPKRVLKAGELPKVHVWAEKSTNNKFVTIARNLEAYGLDLELLARQWRKHFSSSCSVVDPAAKMISLKPGTKIPREIHLQGNLAPKVETVLLSDVKFPPAHLVSKKY